MMYVIVSKFIRAESQVPKVSLNFAPLNLKTPTNPHRVVAHHPFFHHTHHKNPYFKKPEY